MPWFRPFHTGINRGRVRRYLRKPWDHDELHATLAKALDLYQMASRVTSLERRLVDTGPGIPLELLEHVFDPFSPAGRDRGAGLGLVISKTIVEEIGGRLQAENRLTGGALFPVRLTAMGD